MAEISNFKVRPFGLHCEDLDIDFKRRSQPYISVSLLSACLQNVESEKIPPEKIWALDINLRLQLLLRIAIATQGKKLEIKARCNHPECAELFEIPLDLSHFVHDAQAAGTIACQIDANEIKMRLPNGLDQIDWLRAAQRDLLSMAENLIISINGQSLAEYGSLPAEWLHFISAALQEHDRLTALQLHTSCPACEAALQLDFDLECQLLEILALRQNRLLKQINRLALAYHWSEAEIMALTPQRRQAYLAMLEEGSFA